MKKQYKILLGIIVLEFLGIVILDKYEIRAQTWIENAIGTFLFLVPIQTLLALLERDEQFMTKRLWIRITFWFIMICYILGGIALALSGLQL